MFIFCFNFAAPAEKQLPPGSDFMDLEEQSPQRSSVQSSDANVEVPEPRITAPEGGLSVRVSKVMLWFRVALKNFKREKYFTFRNFISEKEFGSFLN